MGLWLGLKLKIKLWHYEVLDNKTLFFFIYNTIGLGLRGKLFYLLYNCVRVMFIKY